MAEIQRLVAEMSFTHPVHIMEGTYDPQIFYEMARGLEKIPEGGERCFKCYRLRMEEAAKLAKENMEERSAKEIALRDHLIERVLKEIPYTRLNGHRTDRLPNNANFCFRFIEGESMLILLDQAGICGSSGSACTSGSLDPSHVLLAIGLPHEIAHGSLRLTLSAETTMEDIDFVVDCIKQIIERLRSMSPLYEDFVKKNQK